MSIEQIAAIKAKWLAKKRGTIKTGELEGGEGERGSEDCSDVMCSGQLAVVGQFLVWSSDSSQITNVLITTTSSLNTIFALTCSACSPPCMQQTGGKISVVPHLPLPQ